MGVLFLLDVPDLCTLFTCFKMIPFRCWEFEISSFIFLHLRFFSFSSTHILQILHPFFFLAFLFIHWSFRFHFYFTCIFEQYGVLSIYLIFEWKRNDLNIFLQILSQKELPTSEESKGNICSFWKSHIMNLVIYG